jgi:hypothetical protein
MDTKKLLGIQSLFLFGGTIFAWSKLIPQFTNFQSQYGTLFRFHDLYIPNPLLTACLYGSTAFLVALYWSTLLYQNQTYVSERRLRNFLLFCVAFAGSVVAYEAVAYYHLFDSSTTAFICTPGVHPLQTPCFYGMLFFIGAFITSIFSTRRLKSVPETII